MDEATLELIAGLCMRTGTLMEDCSADLVSTLPLLLSSASIKQRIGLIEQAGEGPHGLRYRGACASSSVGAP